VRQTMNLRWWWLGLLLTLILVSPTLADQARSTTTPRHDSSFELLGTATVQP